MGTSPCSTGRTGSTGRPRPRISPSARRRARPWGPRRSGRRAWGTCCTGSRNAGPRGRCRRCAPSPPRSSARPRIRDSSSRSGGGWAPRGCPPASVSQRVERLLEPVGVRALGLRQRLEPVGDLLEAFAACRLGHAGVHVGVFVRLAGDCGLEVLARGADRQVGGRVSHLREIVEVPVRVAGLALGGGTEDRGDVVLALDVGLVCEIEVTAVRLRLAGERGLEVVVGLGAFEGFHADLQWNDDERNSTLRVAPEPDSVQLIVSMRAIGAAYGAARSRFSAPRKAAAAPISPECEPLSTTISPATRTSRTRLELPEKSATPSIARAPRASKSGSAPPSTTRSALRPAAISPAGWPTDCAPPEAAPRHRLAGTSGA